MEVSSPPTIRSFVCVPQRPGGGRSDSVNRCCWDPIKPCDGTCEPNEPCDGICDPKELCDGICVPIKLGDGICAPNELSEGVWGPKLPWDENCDPKRPCEGFSMLWKFGPPNKFDNIDCKIFCHGSEFCNGELDEYNCCWDGVCDGQQT